MKIIKGFKRLSYYDKSSLIATWLQTIAVVGGIFIALTQLSASISSNNLDRNKESIALIEEYHSKLENKQNYLRDIHHELSLISKIKNSKIKIAKIDSLLKKIDKKNLITSYGDLSEYYDRVYDCVRTDVCNKEVVGYFICEESEVFLNMGNYPEMRESIDSTYRLLYGQVDASDSNIKFAIDGAKTIHIWNIQRMCPMLTWFDYL